MYRKHRILKEYKDITLAIEEAEQHLSTSESLLSRRGVVQDTSVKKQSDQDRVFDVGSPEYHTLVAKSYLRDAIETLRHMGHKPEE